MRSDERTVTKVRKLLPVILATKRSVDPAHPGALISHRVLTAADDTDITVNDLPLDWLQYMRLALNNYYVARQNMDGMPEVEKHQLVTAVTIFGEPVSHRSWNMIRKVREELVVSKDVDLPIRDKVWITCVFCEAKGTTDISLPELCAGIADDLVRLNILPKRKISTIFSMDGSKKVQTDGDPKTIVYIRS